MSKVWVVEEGQFSEARVVGVFDDEAKLKEFTVDSGELAVYEFEMNATGGQKVQRFWQVALYLERDFDRRTRSTDEPYHMLHETGKCMVLVEANYGSPREGPYVVVASPISREHAVKVAAEKKQEYQRLKGLGMDQDTALRTLRTESR